MRRGEAIFGFCDIRNFTDATEVLQARAARWLVARRPPHPEEGSPKITPAVLDILLKAWARTLFFLVYVGLQVWALIGI